MVKKLDSKGVLLVLGAILGLGMATLAYFGNPGNMALCTACFIRDIMGSLGFHQAPPVQYFRPEIVGIMGGAFLSALFTKRFEVTSSSNPGLRFLGGVILMVNALVFLGCTLRMLIRLSAGDLSAVFGLVGFVAGVYLGVLFLKRGFNLPKAAPTTPLNGSILPLIMVLLFILFLVAPQFFHFSEKGPGSMHANIWLSLVVGALFGVIAHRTRLCFSGATRNILLMKDFKLAMPIFGMFVVLLIYNLVSGDFHLASFGPIAHAQNLWNVLSMFAVGLAGVLFSGCPVRQVVLAGSGSGDGLMTTIGMMIGAALAHNLGLASQAASLKTATEAASPGGPALAGKVFVLVSILLLVGLGYYFSGRKNNVA